MLFDKELTFAKSLALRAGDMMLAGFAKSSVTVKSNLTPVTETDIAISKLVIEEVKKNFPTHAVLDEEIHHDIPMEEFVWVCDPIDGTVPFAHHIPTSMFSLALCYKGEPVVAVLYDPYEKRMLFTQRDSSTFLNDTPVQVSQREFLKGDYIYGQPYLNEEFDFRRYKTLLARKGLNMTSVESFCYENMLVCMGLATAEVTIGCMPWDRAAVILLVRNAGGICTDEQGNPITVFGNPKLFIASNRIVHDELREMVSKSLSHN